MANDRADAGNTVAALAFFGVLGIVVGVGWAYVVWPDPGAGDSRLLPVLGLLVASVGGFSLMAAIVAASVRLGIRWSGLQDEIVDELRRRPPAPSASHLEEDGL